MHNRMTSGPTGLLARAAGLLLAACLLWCALPGTALADSPPALAKFAGTYKYAGSREQGIAIVEKATEEALADLTMVLRALAKRALSQSFAEVILIETPGGKIGLKVGDLDKVTADIDKPQTVKSSDGKREAKLTYQFDGKRIIATLAGEELKSVTYFTLAGDAKTLALDVQVTSKRMAKPVKYRLMYTKQ